MICSLLVFLGFNPQEHDPDEIKKIEQEGYVNHEMLPCKYNMSLFNSDE